MSFQELGLKALKKYVNFEGGSMRKKLLPAVIFAFYLVSGLSMPAFSGALDQLLSISGGSMPNVPDPGEPMVVDPQPVEQQQQGSSGIFNFFSRPEPTYEEIQARNRRREERRIAREKARKRSEQESRDRARREKREQERKAWPKGLPQKRSAYNNQKIKSSLASIPATPKPGEEHRTMQDVALKIKGLRAKKSLSSEEKQALFNLEELARTLWLQALNNQKNPGSTKKLVVPLPVAGDASHKGLVILSSNHLNNFKTSKNLKFGTILDPISGLYQEKTGQLIELKAEEYANKISGGQSHFAEMLTVGKIAMNVSGKDYVAASGEAVNYLIGKIPYPQAQLAAEGGKIYARTSFQVLNEFMHRSMNAVGGRFDQKEFWQELKKELNPAQKTFLKWVEDPSQ